MRTTITILGMTYGYDKDLYLIITEKQGKRSVPFAIADREKCWKHLFDRAYLNGIYIVGDGDDMEEESFVDRITHNRIPFYVGEGIYDIDTEKPIFLIWWDSYTYKEETNKLISISEVLTMYNEDELKSIFLELSLVTEIEINGKIGFGSKQLSVKYSDCWENKYNKDFYLLHIDKENETLSYEFN
jgi:hypothetical protein